MLVAVLVLVRTACRCALTALCACCAQVGTVKLSMPGLTKLKQDEKRSKKNAAKAKAAKPKGE